MGSGPVLQGAVTLQTELLVMRLLYLCRYSETNGPIANDTGIPASGGLKGKLVKRLNLRFKVRAETTGTGQGQAGCG
jgi:hypothetical protein